MSFGDDNPLCSASSAVRRLDGVTSTSRPGPQRLRPPRHCTSTGGWSCSGCSPSWSPQHPRAARIRARCRVLVQGGEWPDPAGRPGRERLLDVGGDIRRLAGIDVVVTGCIIKGRHGHDRCRQATGRQAPQRARLRVDGRGAQSRLNRGSPMLNAQRPTTPQQEPGMAGAEEPPIMGPADPIPASGAGQRFSLDRIASTSYRTDLAVPGASRGRARR
jgi:hypothetical protein